MRKIREFGQRIGREFNPDKVLLFGSYAEGGAGPNSDIDLMVIMSSKGPTARKAVEIRLSLDYSVPIDVLVRTPSEVRKRIAMGDDFIKDIIEKGVLLYERDRR